MSDFLKAYCNTCKRKTNHETLKKEERKIDDDDDQVTFWDTWEIIRCLGCEDISFRHTSGNSHDYYNSEDNKPFEDIRLYPMRSDGAIGIKPYYNVPTVIRGIYRETIDAYNNGLNMLCAAGLRAIIEAICSEEKIDAGLVEKKQSGGSLKSVKSKSLDGKINGLFEKHIITEKQRDSIHEHRYLGNAALHEHTTPHKEILKTAIEIIELILDSLYEINEKAGRLMYRRQLIEKRRNKK